MAWLKVKTCLLAIPDFKIVHVECRFVVEGFSADTIEGNVHDDFGVVKGINFAARSVFAVYIVHQTPAFIHYQWNFLCRADSFVNASPAVFAGVVVGISFAVFLVVSAVDFIRLRFLEPHYMALPPVKWICSRISSFYRDWQ